jgi:hypothetical protein
MSHMNEPTPPPSPLDPNKGLPAVVPPSGRHIVQLFLIPGLIVAGAVTILLGFSWLAGGNRTPEQFLKNIDSTNADVRWRAANDLAQVLKRDDELAANVDFALKIAERFSRALDELERAERYLQDAGADPKDQAESRKTLVAQRNYVQYLAASLGNFSIPVGAPLLCDVAANGRGTDEKLRYTVRRGAVWALANLGEGRKRFNRLPEERRAAVLRDLEVAAAGAGIASEWAKVALAGLKGESIGVIAALAICARDPRDIFLREQTAHALIFWDGTPEEQRLAEETLLLLVRDVGAGHNDRIELKDGE